MTIERTIESACHQMECLIKRPIVFNGKQVTVGFKEEEFEQDLEKLINPILFLALEICEN